MSGLENPGQAWNNQQASGGCTTCQVACDGFAQLSGRGVWLLLQRQCGNKLTHGARLHAAVQLALSQRRADAGQSSACMPTTGQAAGAAHGQRKCMALCWPRRTGSPKSLRPQSSPAMEALDAF